MKSGEEWEAYTRDSALVTRFSDGRRIERAGVAIIDPKQELLEDIWSLFLLLLFGENDSSDQTDREIEKGAFHI